MTCELSQFRGCFFSLFFHGVVVGFGEIVKLIDKVLFCSYSV